MAIEGKVAKILNTREIVINKGALDGVEAGMKFNVQGPKLDVIDPDSEETLGHLVREKLRVLIVEVERRFSVGRTFETYQAIDLEAPNALVVAPAYVRKVKTIRTGSEFEFREGSAYVSVGDLVIQAPQPQK